MEQESQVCSNDSYMRESCKSQGKDKIYDGTSGEKTKRTGEETRTSCLITLTMMGESMTQRRPPSRSVIAEQMRLQ